MEGELLRKVQLTLLEIAVEIKRVCEENDIRYFSLGWLLPGRRAPSGLHPMGRRYGYRHAPCGL